MISWHKPGQKVTVVGIGWRWSLGPEAVNGPAEGEICTISDVIQTAHGVCFRLIDYTDVFDLFHASRFRPVYPQIIDQLRNLDAPLPEHERVKEEA